MVMKVQVGKSPHKNGSNSLKMLISITLIYSNSGSHKNIKMKQKGGKKSKNYQSAGEITINNKDD